MLNRRAFLAGLGVATFACSSGSALAQATTHRVISAWGDSLTRGSGASPGGGYPEQIAAVTGRSIENHGIGGQTGAEILARMRAAEGLPDRMVVIWAGRNDVNGGNVEAIISNIAEMVGLTDGEHYLVLSLTNGKSEPRGTPHYQTIAAANSRLAETYGDRFVDVRSELVSVPDLSDTAASEQDYIPGLLRADDIHFNDIGYQIVADAVLTRLDAFGW